MNGFRGPHLLLLSAGLLLSLSACGGTPEVPAVPLEEPVLDGLKHRRDVGDQFAAGRRLLLPGVSTRQEHAVFGQIAGTDLRS